MTAACWLHGSVALHLDRTEPMDAPTIFWIGGLSCARAPRSMLLLAAAFVAVVAWDCAQLLRPMFVH